MRGSRGLVALTVAMAALSPGASTSAAAADAVEEPCIAGLAEAVGEVSCHVVDVPERHDDPGGLRIRIRVTILPATGPDPAPDPVIFLPGGPGAIGLDAVGALADAGFRRSRDLILLDPRGTPRAEPWLACPVLDQREAMFAADPGADTDFAEIVGTAAEECAAELRAGGVDLAAYTTTAAADDVEAVREALGIERWNLYGSSYGTRVALEVLRRHPGVVRAAVLDGVDPPGVDRLTGRTTRLAEALAAADAACEADPACVERFGDLDGLARAAFDRWRGSAEIVTAPIGPDVSVAVPMGPSVVAGVVLSGLAGAPDRLPLVLEQLANGDTTPVELTTYEPAEIAEGLRLSVECAESVSRLDSAKRDEADAAHPDLAAAFRRFPETVACERWPVPAAASDFAAPVRSDVPVLLLSGALDPITPPPAAASAMASLLNGRHHVVAAGGHGAGLLDPCAQRIRDEFLADPAGASPACDDLEPARFESAIRLEPGIAGVWRAVFVDRLTQPPLGTVLAAIGVLVAIAAVIALVRLARGSRALGWRVLLAATVAIGAVAVAWARVWLDPASGWVGPFGIPDALAWTRWVAAAAVVLVGLLVAVIVFRRDASVRERVAVGALGVGPALAALVFLRAGLLPGA